MEMLPRLLAAGALAASLYPAAATADAQPVIEPLGGCYVAAQPSQTQPVSIIGHGFMPNAPIDVYVDDILQTPAPGTPAPQADAAGTVIGSVPAPYIPLGVHRFTLRLTDHDNAADTATAASFVTLLAVEQAPAKAATGARVRFRGRGFTAPGPVYAHYVYKGVSHKTAQVAQPHGACGAFSRRVRQFPFRGRPKVGTWTIQFDQVRRYTPDAPVFVRLPIKVSRTIKG